MEHQCSLFIFIITNICYYDTLLRLQILLLLLRSKMISCKCIQTSGAAAARAIGRSHPKRILSNAISVILPNSDDFHIKIFSCKYIEHVDHAKIYLEEWLVLLYFIVAIQHAVLSLKLFIQNFKFKWTTFYQNYDELKM